MFLYHGLYGIYYIYIYVFTHNTHTHFRIIFLSLGYIDKWIYLVFSFVPDKTTKGLAMA